MRPIMAATARIDRAKLRVALQDLDEDLIFELLEQALELLPPAKVAALIKPYVDLARLRPDPGGSMAMPALLAIIQDFAASCRRGHYYETFRVNSRNYTEQSRGTKTFIAECKRLFERLLALAPAANPAQASEAFELLLGLLRSIDNGDDEIIFFADEGGSWQVGLDWSRVLPAWCACLARVSEAPEYAKQVVDTIIFFDDHNRDKGLASARECATPQQLVAIESYLESMPKRRR